MKTLLISDVHQDIAWLRDVLQKEGEADRIIFMGDWFDSHAGEDNVAPVAHVAQFIIDLMGTSQNLTFLLGNHDVPYMETSHAIQLNGFSTAYTKHICSGFTKSKAKKINKVMLPYHWDKFELFAYDQGFLISHAGIGMGVAADLCGKKSHGDIMDEDPTFYEVLEALGNEEIEALRAIKTHQWHPLLNVGSGRGGRGMGGMTWQDWDEFRGGECQINPQIMGHTTRYKDVRDNECGSYCIDGLQTSYGVIEDGVFRHDFVENKNSEEFHKKILAAEKRRFEAIDKLGIGTFMC